MPSPICQVKVGAGSYQATTFGVNITASVSATIKLADITDVNSWSYGGSWSNNEISAGMHGWIFM